jgi:hypothetical protein
MSVLNPHYDSEKEKMTTATTDRENSVRERHQTEREIFQREWGDPRALIEFSKPSTHLLQMRAIEHKMAMGNDFEGAANMKKLADRLQSQETKAAQTRAQKAMEAAADRLLRKQKLDLDVLHGIVDRRFDSLECERHLRVLPYEKGLERALDLEKVTKGQTLCPQRAKNATYQKCLFSGRQDVDAILGDTFRKQLEFRSEPPGLKLTLVPLDSARLFRDVPEPKRRAHSSLRHRRSPSVG